MNEFNHNFVEKSRCSRGVKPVRLHKKMKANIGAWKDFPPVLGKSTGGRQYADFAKIGNNPLGGSARCYE